MADTLAHLKRDRSFWKRLLRFAGYYHGKIDWLNTKEFRFSQAKWKNETEGLRRILAYFDSESEANISTLHPKAQKAARLWLPYAKVIAHEAGYDVRIICGTRTYMEQDALSENDKTKARGGQSMHNFGLAWDIGIFQGKNTLRSTSCTRFLDTYPAITQI